MQTCRLIPHSEFLPVAVTGIAVSLAWKPHWLTLRYRIEGPGALVIPPLAGRKRADGLWQTTCFELFVHHGTGAGYSEFNLSPSQAWAAYDFAAYREGMAERAMPVAPVGNWRGASKTAFFDAAIPVNGLPNVTGHLGLSAVIEEQGGRKSYWALSHPSAAPDFHHPDCFTLQLAPPETP